MARKPDKKTTTAPDKFFVLGFDNKGKPRGARFAEYNERVLEFILDLMLTAVYPASPAFAEAAMKLPPGPAHISFVQIIETAEGGFGVNGQIFVPRGK